MPMVGPGDRGGWALLQLTDALGWYTRYKRRRFRQNKAHNNRQSRLFTFGHQTLVEHWKREKGKPV